MQFPLVPAFAMTDYKCQGQTFASIIVDLAKPPTGLLEIHLLHVILHIHIFSRSVFPTTCICATITSETVRGSCYLTAF